MQGHHAVRGGYDNVELAAAQRRGVPVCNVPDYGTEEVDDSAIGMMLTLTRGIHLLHSRLRDSREEWHYTHAAPLVRLRGRTLVSSAWAESCPPSPSAARPSGCASSTTTPTHPTVTATLGVTRAEALDELLVQSDVITCHCWSTIQFTVYFPIAYYQTFDTYFVARVFQNLGDQVGAFAEEISSRMSEYERLDAWLDAELVNVGDQLNARRPRGYQANNLRTGC